MKALSAGTLLVVMLLLAPPAGAATTVTIDATTQAGSLLTVAGRASFGNQPFVALGTDAAGDAPVPGAEFLGKDVISFSASTAVGGDVTLRWHLSQLTPGVNRGVDVAYGKAFCVTPSPDLNCWVVIFADPTGTLNSFGQGWQCSDETCAITAGNWLHTWETDVYDPATKTASLTIPAGTLGIAPGSTLTGATSSSFGSSVFVTTPWWFLGLGPTYPVFDATAISADYAVPSKRVSVAIGAPGQAPSAVSYPIEASISETSGFDAVLDTTGLAPGAYTVYVRACFGANNCGYATRDVTL